MLELAPIVSAAPLKQCELTILMPCLNEAETLPQCITKARRFLAEQQVAGEVLVADNGSTDGSAELASKLGARVVMVAERGYGHALRGGIAAARSRFVIMGDADDSYDFAALGAFLAQLRAGADLVQGCRLPAGGGTISTWRPLARRAIRTRAAKGETGRLISCMGSL